MYRTFNTHVFLPFYFSNRFLNVPFSFMVQLSVGSVYGMALSSTPFFFPSAYRVPIRLTPLSHSPCASPRPAPILIPHITHICYVTPPAAWSVFNSPLTRELGVVTSAADDWGLSQVLPIFSTCALTLGVTTAFLGWWSVAGCCSALHSAIHLHTTHLPQPTRAVGGACWSADGRHGGGYGGGVRQRSWSSLPPFTIAW